MADKLPGQRGLPDVAPDVPLEDWEAAFDPPEREEDTPVILALVFDGVRWSEVETKLAQLAWDLGAKVVMVYTDRKGE